MNEDQLERELVALATLPPARLRQKWSDVTGKPLPRVSPAMLRLALAWELQTRAHGGLSRRARQRLDQIGAARSATRPIRPGMRFTREWNGTLHVVTIDEDGTIEWDGRSWASLSSVARDITGTRWSGPAFFGLRKARKTA